MLLNTILVDELSAIVRVDAEQIEEQALPIEFGDMFTAQKPGCLLNGVNAPDPEFFAGAAPARCQMSVRCGPVPVENSP